MFEKKFHRRVIFLIAAVVAAPILVQALQDTPDSQLQHLTSLVNSAILWEAVIRKKITLATLTTDWIILDQVPHDGKDWISALDSNPKYNEIKQLMENKFGPVQEVLMNGFKEEVPLEYLDKVDRLVKSFESLPAMHEAAKKGIEIIEKYDVKVYVDLKTYLPVFSFFGFLPQAIPFLQNVSSSADFGKVVSNGFDIIEMWKNVNVTNIEGSLSDCKKYEVPDKAKSCLSGLSDAFKNFPTLFTASDVKMSAYFIRAFLYAKQAYAEWLPLLSKKHNIPKLREILEKISSIRKSLTVVNSRDQETLRSIRWGLDQLKSQKNKLNLLVGSLEKLTPISEAISKISQYNSTSNQRTTPSNRFGSYRGFPDGTKSLQDLFEVSKIEKMLPSRFLNSKITERIASIGHWYGETGLLLQNSNGFNSIPNLIMQIRELSSFMEKFDFTGTDAGTNFTTKYLSSLPTFESLQKTVESVRTVELALESFEKNKNVKDVFEKLAALTITMDLTVLDELFWPIPEVAEFALGILNDLEKLKLKDFQLNTMSEVEQISLAKAVYSHTEVYEKLISHLKEFKEAVGKHSSKIERPRAQEKADLNVLKDFKIQKWELSGDLSSDRLKGSFDTAAKLDATMEQMKADTKSHMQSFVAHSKDLETLKEAITSPGKSSDIGKIKPLLEILTKTKSLHIDPSREEPNGFLLNLIEDNPFGSKVLYDMEIGVAAYRKLVQGIDLGKLADEVKFFRSDTSINGAVRHFVDGVEFVQMKSDPSDVYTIFADNSRFPKRIKKLHEWISKVASLKKSQKVPSLEAYKIHVPTIQQLCQRAENAVVGDFEVLSKRIDFLFDALKKGKMCNRKDLKHPDCIPDDPPEGSDEEIMEGEKMGEPIQAEMVVEETNSTTTEEGLGTIWIVAIAGVVCFVILSVAVLVTCEIRKRRKAPKQHRMKGDFLPFPREGSRTRRERNIRREPKNRREPKRPVEEVEEQSSEKSATPAKKEKPPVQDDSDDESTVSKEIKPPPIAKTGKTIEKRVEPFNYRDYIEKMEKGEKNFDTRPMKERQKRELTAAEKKADEDASWNHKGTYDGVRENPAVSKNPLEQVKQKLTIFTTLIRFEKERLIIDEEVGSPHEFVHQILEEFGRTIQIDPSQCTTYERIRGGFFLGTKVPLEWSDTLVKLKDDSYISASIVRGIGKMRIIATRAPIDVDKGPFFEMIEEYRCDVIIQLCSSKEMKDACGMMRTTSYEDNLERTEHQCDLDGVRHTTMKYNNGIFDRTVEHFVYQKWKDDSIPDDRDILTKLMDHVENMFPDKKNVRVVVHCLHGLGRTGTFLMIALARERLLSDRFDFSFYEVLCIARRQRNMAVRNPLQYLYAIGATCNYIKRIGKPLNAKFEPLYLGAIPVLKAICLGTYLPPSARLQSTQASDSSKQRRKKRPTLPPFIYELNAEWYETKNPRKDFLKDKDVDREIILQKKKEKAKKMDEAERNEKSKKDEKLKKGEELKKEAPKNDENLKKVEELKKEAPEQDEKLKKVEDSKKEAPKKEEEKSKKEKSEKDAKA